MMAKRRFGVSTRLRDDGSSGEMRDSGLRSADFIHLPLARLLLLGATATAAILDPPPRIRRRDFKGPSTREPPKLYTHVLIQFVGSFPALM